MAIKLKRFGGTEKESYCIEIQGYWPDATMILIHLERLNGIDVLSNALTAITDDVQIEFLYKGYPFIITGPFAYLWISADSPDVPESMFEEIVEHIRNYKPVWRILYLLVYCGIKDYQDGGANLRVHGTARQGACRP